VVSLQVLRSRSPSPPTSSFAAGARRSRTTLPSSAPLVPSLIASFDSMLQPA
jgi:hypothetical protein